MADAPVTILMLDDDEDEFLIVKRLLDKGRSRYALEWTASVEAALADMCRGGHQVYLVDYRMGMVSGLEVIDQAVRAGVRAPVILLTAATPAEDGSDLDIQALRSGAADYLSKNELTVDALERSIRYARERAASAMLREDLGRAEETGARLRAALEELERQATRLRLLAEASHVFALAPADLDGTLQEVVRRCAETLGDACFVVLLEENRSGAVIRAIRHVDPSIHAFGLATLRGAHVDLDRSVSGRVIREGQPRLIPTVGPGAVEVTSSERAQRFHARYPIRSAVFVPLRASGEILGVLALLRTGQSAAPYTLEDQTLLQDIADRAALAIKNAALFTAQLTAGERERAARREAEEANRAKDEFLAMLGHELRNPLAPILTAVQLLELRGGPETARELAVLRRQSQHLVRLVDDLLDVSRIARGKIALNRELLELSDVVAAAIELARPLIDSGRHALVLDLPRSGLPVNVDRVRFAQAISNLLANSAKYTERGGRIAVRGRAVGGDVVLDVEDNGAGIAADLLPRVFELFVQSPQTLNRAKGGLGLGLAIVKNMVGMHGGSVSAESAGPGRGSTFSIRVPLARGTEAAFAHALSDAPSAVSAGRGRVLVVDDNKDAAEMLAEALGSMGYRAATAHDAPEALRVADDFLPDIGLLDIGLPVVDGYDLARQLLHRHANLRLVAVSGYGLEADKRRAREAGFVDHLTKPVELDSLARMLTEVAAVGG